MKVASSKEIIEDVALACGERAVRRPLGLLRDSARLGMLRCKDLLRRGRCQLLCARASNLRCSRRPTGWVFCFCIGAIRARAVALTSVVVCAGGGAELDPIVGSVAFARLRLPEAGAWDFGRRVTAFLEGAATRRPVSRAAPASSSGSV